MKSKLILLIIIVISIMTILAVTNTKSNAGNINTKICWGIKRNNNHNQPDLGKENKEIIEKYKGIAIGNDKEKKIYLTFDLGYEAGYTEKILDILKENEVKACFFITAHYFNTNQELVKRMIEEGHDVGNHTVNHKSLPELSDEEVKSEIMNLHTAVYEKFGYEMKYVRPPKGEYSERVLQLCNDMNYTTVMWSFAYDDWDESKQGREEYGKKKILENLHPGEVMLLHGTSKDNMNILEECVKEIKKEGYKFMKIGEID